MVPIFIKKWKKMTPPVFMGDHKSRYHLLEKSASSRVIHKHAYFVSILKTLVVFLAEGLRGDESHK